MAHAALALQAPVFLLRRIWHSRRGRRLLLVLAGTWLFHYHRSVRSVRLHLASSQVLKSEAGERVKRIVERCEALSRVYWPTWYAHTAFQQLILLGFKEIRARVLQRSPYNRQVLKLRDGASVALDWVIPTESQAKLLAPNAPICILLHGAVQDSASVTMKDLARSLARRGLPVVVLNRRGYGGLVLEAASAKVTLFGFDEDLDDVMLAVGCRMPGRPVAIIGFSCGSGYAGRYTGTHSHLSAWSKTQSTGLVMPRILCAVAFDPGYDVSPDGAVANIPVPYSWAMNWAVKYQYAFRHLAPMRQKSPSFSEVVSAMLNPTLGLRETYRKARRLSGIGDSSAWLDMQQTRLESIQVPTLAINSRDDPICVWANVEAHMEIIKKNPNLVLAELQRGSHGCKFDFWGLASAADDMIGDFVCAAWNEHQALSPS